jgi:integrase/recombinase XerD
VPDGVAPRGAKSLSAKTVLNIHTNLSALWHWAEDEGLVKKNIIRSIEPPPVSEAVIQTLTKDETDLLLKACDTTRTWKSRAETSSARSTGARDRAIILTLLDTGVRASELCGIKYCDLNMNNHSLKVSGKGPGRAGTERKGLSILAGARPRQFGNPCCHGSTPFAWKILCLSLASARTGVR